MVNSRGERKIKKNKGKKKRVLKWVLLTLSVLLVCITLYIGNLYMKANQVIDKSFENDGRGNKSALREKEVDPLKDNVSVLIMGIDESESRADEGVYRTDALILATLNIDNHTVKMLSIPRDSYVYIPEIDRMDKINHAYAFGETKATIETIENLLEIPVDYYVKVNFEAFIDVVDSLGGITVDVPFEFKEQNSKDQKGAIHLYPGVQELNGEEALALARTRKLDNDIERGKRQQEIIKAVVKKAVSLGSVFKIGDLIDAVGENMKTNLTFNDMKSFVAYGMDGKLNMETLTLQGYDDWSTGIYYYKLDEAKLEEIKQELKNHLGF